MKIKKIDNMGHTRVYDLTVTDHPNYIANGQVVHNCLKDISRVFDVPLREVNEVTGSIIERSSGDERASQTIEDSFKDFKVCREFDAKYPMVLKHAKRLEGMAKNLGIHAAGAVVAPEPIVNYLPLEVRKSNGEDVVVTALDMMGVAAVGLVKLDVLGLRTLTVLREACEGIEKNHGIWVDLEALELNDKKTLDGFTKHDYAGIFQYDTASADKVCTGVKFEAFEDVAAMTALNRPGTARSGLATQYVARKKDPSKIKEASMHPKVSEITADTLGIIVYQEHVIKIFTDIAGFAPGTADSLRKSIAKKKGDETIGKERANFIEGAMKNTPDMSLKQAEKIIDAITFFGCLYKDEMVATPAGPRKICELKTGDEVFSATESGTVLNRIKSVWPTGIKKVKRLVTDAGENYPTDQHWFQLENGEYKKVVDLEPGMVLYSPMGSNPIGGKNENVHNGGVRPGTTRQGAVFGALPAGIPEAEGIGESWAGQGVEKRQNETYASRSSRTSQESVGSEEPGLERWPHKGFQRDEKGDYQGMQSVRALRSEAGTKSPRANQTIATHSPHRPEQGEQPTVQSGGAVPEMPFVGTRQRTDNGQEGTSATGARIIAIEDAFEDETWDLEVEDQPNNYLLANGLSTHNSYGFNKSHATAYGVIAYWGMWLKTYYPLEFYCALLKNEPDRIAIQRIAKDAKTRGIKLLPPDVSVSQKHFAMDVEHYAIRGSLVDVKGVGETAANTIMENQPYKSFTDFADRIDRRKCNRGTVKSLMASGALSKFVPNVKWLLDNLDTVWGLATKGKYKEAEELLEASKSEEQYTEEEAQLLASSVSPLAFGKHPIDAYGKFVKRAVGVPIVDMSSEDFFKDFNNKSVYIMGVIVEVKYNQIGDFHTGSLPTPEEMEAAKWGSRYANVNVEDKGGVQNRIKFDIDIFDDMRPLIDSGIGTPVVVHANVNGSFQNLRANFAINLEEYRKKVRDGGKLTLCELIIAGKHPATTHKWVSKERKKKRVSNVDFHKSLTGGTYCGVIMHLKTQRDKRGYEMAFFGITGAKSHIEVICFASNWGAAQKDIEVGAFVEIAVEKKPDRSRGMSYFYGGGGIRKLKTFTIS